ncbi:MAG: heme o synthase [Thermomicrobiales bacterium]
MTTLNDFRRLLIATLIVGFLLVIVGGIVRVEGAGMGCGDDWPICNGEVVPTFHYLTMLEYSHRVIAGIVMLLTAMVAYAGWRLRAAGRWIIALPLLALALVVAQALLGAVTVFVELEPEIVTAHLGMAQGYLALLVVLTLLAYRERTYGDMRIRAGSFGAYGLAAAAGVFVLMLTGAYTATSAAAWACPEWPGCRGNYVPTGTTVVDIHLIHRWAALLALVAVITALVQARRVRPDDPAILGLMGGAAAVMIAQIFIGAMNIWFELASWVSVTHLGAATILWTTLVAAVTLDAMRPTTEADRGKQALHPGQRPARAVLGDYANTMKPGVLVLLLLTTLAAMLVAAAGLPPLRIVFWTLIGGMLSAGGAGAINHYLDRDIDRIMSRTRNRPLPGGRIPPVEVAIFGVVLSIMAVMVLVAFVNVLAALLALAGNLFYVFVYTIWLKRRTPQNIVIGGAAGSMPPMVGWAAATGTLGLSPLLMFGLIFLWTPPHFWALALFKRTDYAAAGVPMLPAVRGEAETRRQILIYTVLTVATSLLLYATGGMGTVYLIAAIAIGAVFMVRSLNLYRFPTDDAARRLFLYSMQYLGIIFVAMVIDRVLGL